MTLDEAAERLRVLTDEMCDIVAQLHADQRHLKTGAVVMIAYDGTKFQKEGGLTYVDRPQTLKELCDEFEKD